MSRMLAGKFIGAICLQYFVKTILIHNNEKSKAPDVENIYISQLLQKLISVIYVIKLQPGVSVYKICHNFNLTQLERFSVAVL